MSGDSLHVHDEEQLAQRVRDLGERAARLETLRDRLGDELSSKKAEVVELGSRVEKLSKVEALFRALMDLLVVEQVRSLEKVITEGFQTIFDDLELSFESEVTTRYNKVAIDFFIRQGSKDNPVPIRGKPLDSFGGGPTSVASFILRVLALRRLKRFPLMAMDETLGAVSDDYTDNTGEFLRVMAEKMGIDVLLVTHKKGYVDHATRAYRSLEVVEEDQRYLQLKEVR